MKTKLEELTVFFMFMAICTLAIFGGVGIDNTHATETTYMNREAVNK